MSHLSTIKTKLRSRDLLMKALLELGYSTKAEGQSNNNNLSQVSSNNVTVFQKECGSIEFNWNKDDKSYELVTDLDKWQLSIPVERFLAQLTQRYALCNILESSSCEGFQVKEQTQNQEGVVELVLTRWES
ncbi:hypothetical protein PMYN1_Chma137 (chromatophore) [Paulinella micropora]|uniref:Uncharacterized protein ycf35 n=1 Tax=Paulinella micropora TaxID=1928728 RepID=A0A1L5YBA3_9EUKA|nr:hypothetical protein PCKR_174 [Paulinella micropora]AQX44737.1 hypothetical protein PFK_174 [Paulinella micropora]BBL85949.1 hypothetical protein PMYN1_Chma137 [Paulinella micropora]